MTHTETILNRYQPLLEEIFAQVGETSQEIMIDATMDVWSRSNHRACLVLAQLVNREMLTPVAVVDWAFKKIKADWGTENCVTSELWDLVHCGIQFAESFVKAAEKEKADAASQVEFAKESAKDAADRAAEAAAQLESGTTGNVQASLDAINEANVLEERARADVTDAEARLESTSVEKTMAASHLFHELSIKVGVSVLSAANISLQVFDAFLSLLKEKPESVPETSASADPCRMYYRTLSRLGSFCRSYSSRLVDFVAELEAMMDHSGADTAVRRVVLNCLRMGKDLSIGEPMYDAHWFSKKRDSTAQTPAKSNPTSDSN